MLLITYFKEMLIGRRDDKYSQKRKVITLFYRSTINTAAKVNKEKEEIGI